MGLSLQGLAATVARAQPLPAPAEAPLVRQALDRVSRMDYAAAEDLLLEGLPASSPARPYFAGLAAMNRFLDLGDTLALRRAEDYWEALSPREPPSPRFAKTDIRLLKVYRGLAGMQLSYAASLRGEKLRSTRLALAARDQLKDVPDHPEARLGLMLFDYYRKRLLEKLPFMGEADFDAKAFAKRAEASPVLGDMFLGSLFWIHVDHGRYAAAEAITADFLRRFPGNRLARQMRGAALFRAGRFEEARDVQEGLRTEYAALPRGPGILPLGYYRAVGNLARLEARAPGPGGPKARSGLMAEWRKADEAGLMPWLPPVLKRDLAAP